MHGRHSGRASPRGGVSATDDHRPVVAGRGRTVVFRAHECGRFAPPGIRAKVAADGPGRGRWGRVGLSGGASGAAAADLSGRADGRTFDTWARQARPPPLAADSPTPPIEPANSPQSLPSVGPRTP